jgi:hypothetical protein
MKFWETLTALAQHFHFWKMKDKSRPAIFRNHDFTFLYLSFTVYVLSFPFTHARIIYILITLLPTFFTSPPLSQLEVICVVSTLYMELFNRISHLYITNTLCF